MALPARLALTLAVFPHPPSLPPPISPTLSFSPRLLSLVSNWSSPGHECHGSPLDDYLMDIWYGTSVGLQIHHPDRPLVIHLKFIHLSRPMRIQARNNLYGMF